MRSFLAIAFLLMIVLEAKADKVVMLEDAQDSLQARADYITSAKQEIIVQYFTVDHDSTSLAGLALLRDAAGRGVKVKILIDSMHNLIMRETISALLSSLNPAKAKNIELREYNGFKLFRPLCYTKRMHDKGLIIDGKVMISGGRNIANGYFSLPYRDDSGQLLPVYEDSDVLVLESQSVQTAQKYFNDLWDSKMVSPVYLYDYSADALDIATCLGREDASACEDRRRVRARAVKDEEQNLDAIVSEFKKNNLGVIGSKQSKDWSQEAVEVSQIKFLHDDVQKNLCGTDKPKNNIATQLYDLIDKTAEKSVTIVTPYLIVTPEQKDLFKKLIARGVRVRIVTNSRLSNDVLISQAAAELLTPQILELGVEVLEYRGPDTLHAKMVLIDRKVAFIGSFNWDFRSQNLNREVGVIVELPENQKNDFSQSLLQKFNRIIKRTNVVQMDTAKKIKLHELTDEEFEELSMQNEERASKIDSKKNLLIVFPSIIKQL